MSRYFSQILVKVTDFFRVFYRIKLILLMLSFIWNMNSKDSLQIKDAYWLLTLCVLCNRLFPEISKHSVGDVRMFVLGRFLYMYQLTVYPWKTMIQIRFYKFSFFSTPLEFKRNTSIYWYCETKHTDYSNNRTTISMSTDKYWLNLPQWRICLTTIKNNSFLTLKFY